MCTWVGHCINLITFFSFQLQVAGVDERLCSHSPLALISRSRANIPVTYDPVMKGFAIPFGWKSEFLDWCLKCCWPMYFHSNPFNLSPLYREGKGGGASMELYPWGTDPMVGVLFVADRPLVAVSFSALSCTLGFVLLGFLYCRSPSPRVSLSFRARLFIFWPLHSLYPSVLLLAFVSGAVSSEAGQGGWDERFIWAHGVREEAEWELIRISLSKAITLLLTFHLTSFLWTNLSSTEPSRDTEKVLDLG